MNAAPHATYTATGQYYVYHAGFNEPYVVVAPDGTVHGSTYDLEEACKTKTYLNAQDSAARAMTDADRIAAIREIVSELDSRSKWEDDYADAIDAIREALA